MNLKNKLTLFLVFACLIFIKAQDKSFKFGKVPAADIAMEQYELEPDAEAVVLGHTVKMHLQLVNNVKMYYTFHKRIKILKESAFDEGTVELLYYVKNNLERITKLKAMITYPDGNQYKLGKDEFHYEDIDDSYKKITFTFPKLTEGAIIEYRYDLGSEQVTVLDDFIYQEEYPVRYAHVELSIPDNIEYVFVNRGNTSLINKSDDYLVMENIPSMKSESYVTTMKDYRGTIKMQIKGYTDGANTYHPILSTWEKVIEELEENRSFGDQYLRNWAYNKIVSEVTEKIDPTLKGKELFLALQKEILGKVSCNYDYSIYSTDGIENAWKSGEANRSELNIIMIALLRSMDIEAYPMLVSARSHGKVMTTYPFVNQFSYTVVYTELDGKPFFIDVSDKHRPPGMLSHEALNYEGLLVDKEKGGWVNTNMDQQSMDVFFCTFDIEENDLKGQIKGMYSNYNAIPERRYYEDAEDGKHWEGRLREKYPDAKVIKAVPDHGKNLYSSFKEEVEVLIPDACVVANDIMYIDPFLYTNYNENPFKLAERNFPVDFGNPRGEQYVFNINIPEGYEVEEVPESISITNEDRSATYQLTCSVQGDKISINRRLILNKPFYTTLEYASLKKIFDLLLEKDGEQIVLKKV